MSRRDSIDIDDTCECGHGFGEHAARAPHKCLHGYETPWWLNTPDMIKCEVKCQAFILRAGKKKGR